MDAVLLRAGFTASRALLARGAALSPGAAMDAALVVIGAVRELVGDHVAHQPFFLHFPDGVPDTMEFWLSSLRAALVGAGPEAEAASEEQVRAMLDTGLVDLLSLPGYGRRDYSFAELVAAHDELIESAADRMTVLHLGRTRDEELHALYLQLAASPTPLGETDLALLDELAGLCGDGVQPETIPVRENRAVVNTARLAQGRPLVAVDTVTDVLRLACHASGGDVTLAVPARFRGFRRLERRVLMGALDRVVGPEEGKLGDVPRYARRWQRLGERLHPHEYPRFPHARAVFAVARGEKTVRSLAGRVDVALTAGNTARAAQLLSAAPGMLMRQLDRLLRTATASEVDAVLTVLADTAGQVSGRVLVSLREHLVNRAVPGTARMFVNRARGAWVCTENRTPLDPAVIARAAAVLDAELTVRLPAGERLVVDPAVLDLALPLSGKASAGGFRVMPRGTTTPVEGAQDLLRVFTYWRQDRERTDFDLSALLLDDDFTARGQVSWTRLLDGELYHSGDLTEASEGATEFIDVPATTAARYVVPQVHIYAGEGFDQVAESMFGFMTRDRAQQGLPFEARTVRTRSELRGPGRVALPLVLSHGDDGGWSVTWLHLYLRGRVWANRVESHQDTTSLLLRTLVERDYLTVAYLIGLWQTNVSACTEYDPAMELREPVTFVGVDRPENLPAGSRVITIDTPNALIPH